MFEVGEPDGLVARVQRFHPVLTSKPRLEILRPEPRFY